MQLVELIARLCVFAAIFLVFGFAIVPSMWDFRSHAVVWGWGHHLFFGAVALGAVVALLHSLSKRNWWGVFGALLHGAAYPTLWMVLNWMVVTNQSDLDVPRYLVSALGLAGWVGYLFAGYFGQTEPASKPEKRTAFSSAPEALIPPHWPTDLPYYPEIDPGSPLYQGDNPHSERRKSS